MDENQRKGGKHERSDSLPRLSVDFQDRAFIADPYAHYADWHANHPMFFWEQYGMWCFAGFAAVDGLFRDRRFGRQILHVTTRDALGWPERPKHLAAFDAAEANSLLELEPPDHTRLRRLVNRAFVSRHVETLRPSIAAQAHMLIDGFFTDGEADVLEQYIAPLAVTTICRLLGVPESDGKLLLDWSHAMVRMYVANPPMGDQIAANQAAKDFSSWVRDQIAEVRAQGGADTLLGALVAKTEEGETLTDDEIVSTVILLLNAGHEATVHQFGNGLDVLLNNGLNLRDTFADAKTAEAAVSEMLRHNPPLHLFTRYALEDVTLPTPHGDLPLKQGEQIGLLLGAANRDPARFSNPDRFNPNRDDQATVAFGAGIHFCIGAPLARIELEEAFMALAGRLVKPRFATPPRYGDTYHFRGLEHALLRWDLG